MSLAGCGQAWARESRRADRLQTRAAALRCSDLKDNEVTSAAEAAGEDSALQSRLCGSRCPSVAGAHSGCHRGRRPSRKPARGGPSSLLRGHRHLSPQGCH